MKRSKRKKPKPAGKARNFAHYTGPQNREVGLSGSSAKKFSQEAAKRELPTVEELKHIFNRFNHFYFDGKLKKTKIEYSHRMTCAGSYFPEDGLIKISLKYHELFPGEIEDTLKHEMIHIRHFYHDHAFKAEAKRIGASLKAKTHPSLQRTPKFLYVCPGCGLEYPRQKKMQKYSCGDCSANRRYDERFRLKLLKSN